MCCEDYRIGRKIRTVARYVVLPASTVTQIVAPSPNRVMLAIGTTQSNGAWIAPYYNIAINTGLYVLSSGNNLVRFHLVEDGDIVTKPWWGIRAVAATDLIIFEGIVDPDLCEKGKEPK